MKLRPVTLTLLTSNAFYDRVTKELSRSFDSGDKELAERIRSAANCYILCLSLPLRYLLRVISIGSMEFLALSSGDESFKNVWKALVSEEELVCAQTGTRFAPLPKPKAIIIDVSTALSSFVPLSDADARRSSLLSSHSTPSEPSAGRA